jgi:histidyl-tRNA synthetase
VDLVLEEKKVKWAFRHANQNGAKRLVLIAPEEWSAGKVRIKELGSGAEQDLPIQDL